LIMLSLHVDGIKKYVSYLYYIRHVLSQSSRSR
jgi:hypothetical protein